MFSIRDIPKHTMVLQYHGFFLKNNAELEEKYYNGDDYIQNVGICNGLRFDIPKGFEDTSKYNATLAHKINCNFEPNVFAIVVSI